MITLIGQKCVNEGLFLRLTEAKICSSIYIDLVNSH